MPFLVWVRKYRARNQVVRDSLVAWKTVPASRESWRLQWLHWKQARRVESRQNVAEPQREQARPSGQQWHSFKDGIAFVLSGLGEAVNQSAMSGSAGLRSLHFLDGRRDWRG